MRRLWIALALALAAPTFPAPAAARSEVAASVASADGVPIAWRASGQGDVALVLIHGWSCDSSYWDAQVAPFAKDYRVVTLDLAGHGASGTDRKTWSMAAFGADVAAVAAKLPQKRIILVGHSMGGPVALEAARLTGKRVIGVIGVDTLADLGGRKIDPAQVEGFKAALKRDYAGTTRAFVTSFFFPKTADPALVKRIADDMASAPPGVASPAMDALMAYEVQPAAAAVKAPIVTINADYQPAMDEAAARKVAPGFRLVTFTGTGHFPQVEAPERFNAVLRTEIERMAETGRLSVGFGIYRDGKLVGSPTITLEPGSDALVETAGAQGYRLSVRLEPQPGSPARHAVRATLQLRAATGWSLVASPTITTGVGDPASIEIAGDDTAGRPPVKLTPLITEA